MTRRISTLFGVSLALTTILAGHSVTADTITETEPNDTIATANQLIGATNDLGALGTLSTNTDYDTFRFSVTSPGTVQINAFGSLSGGGLTLDNADIFFFDANGKLVGLDSAGGIHNGQLILPNLADGVYYTTVFSGDKPRGSYQGTYRLDVSGTGGAIVGGSAAPVPEASTTFSFGLLLALGGLAVMARKKNA